MNIQYQIETEQAQVETVTITKLKLTYHNMSHYKVLRTRFDDASHTTAWIHGNTKLLSYLAHDQQFKLAAEVML